MLLYPPSFFKNPAHAFDKGGFRELLYMIIKQLAVCKCYLFAFKMIHCGDEGLRSLFVKKEAGDSFFYRVQRAAVTVCDYRAARGIGFYRNYPEVLNAGEEQGFCGSVKPANFLIADSAQESDESRDRKSVV